MRAYVATSGAIFGLLVLAHVLRMAFEGPAVARDPWFVLFTATPAALAVWAFRLLRLPARY